MGLTYVTVRLTGLQGRKAFEDQFLVDTGAIDCLVPASALRRIGVKPVGKDVYELANGQTQEMPFGYSIVKFMGSETAVKVIFGPEGAEPLLGVTALESCGITVNPVSRTLKRLAAKPLK